MEVFVRNPLTTAIISASLVFGVVGGCSAPSTDGTSLGRGPGNNEKEQTETKDDDTSSDTTPEEQADCSSHTPVDNRPACDQCTRANCCTQVLACDDNADCAAIVKCLDDCAGDVVCMLVCQASHSSGASSLQQVASCASTKCSNECPQQQLDAGIDPFGDDL